MTGSEHRFEIRTLPLGELLDEAFILFRGAVVRLIGFQLIAFVPTAIIEALVIHALGAQLIELVKRQDAVGAAGPLAVAVGGLVAVLAIQVIVAPIVGVALTRAVADTYLSRKWTIGDLFRVAVRFAGRSVAIGAVMLVLLAVMVMLPSGLMASVAWFLWNTGDLDWLGGLLLIIVASVVAGLPLVAGVVYVNLRFALAHVALVVEDTSVLEAFRRSSGLMRGRYWSALALWLILLLVSLLLGFAVSAFVPSPSFETLDSDRIRQMLPVLVRSQIVSTVLGEAMGMFTRTFGAIAWTLFYFSRRCEHEGFDLVILAESLGDEADS